MTPRLQELLARAARSHGIDLEFWDIWGRHHVTPPSTLQALLSALGLRTHDEEALSESLQEWHETDWGRLVPAVTVTEFPHAQLLVRTGEPLTQSVRIRVSIHREDGSQMAWDPPHPYTAVDVDDQRQRVEVRLPVPPEIAPGYHDAQIEVRDESTGLVLSRATTRLIVTPPRAWRPEALAADGKLAGVALALYGVRSARNWGVGDFTDLRALVDWAAQDLECAFVALNPLHAIANRQPYNTSPYLPATAFYRNYLYLDIEAVEGFETCQLARSLSSSQAIRGEIDALRNAEYVEYERVARLKLRFLRLLYRHFRQAADPKTFQDWCAGEGEMLDRWAVYCALDETLHKRDRKVWIWPDWPEEYRDADSQAVAGFARTHARLVDFYRWVQYQIHRQLSAAQAHALSAGMPVGLYHDLALATDRCGADLWAYGRFFLRGCRVGAPPDDFAPEGQDWSFPPPNSAAHRADGYRLFVETIRKNSRAGGALRIDHVMRFCRLFCIPDGLPARDGTYMTEDWENLLRILALESHRGKFLVVGEDLGTVPPLLREALERFGILSYRLLYFEKDEAGRPRQPGEYPRQALVSSTTHDLPTLAGFWAGRDIEARRAAGQLNDDARYEQQKRDRVKDKALLLAAMKKAGLLPHTVPADASIWPELTGEIHNAVIGFLASTPSALMVLNQEDLTKETEQQNLPGTTSQYPNWRRKMRFSVEELRAEAGQPRDFAKMFRAWLERTGRAWPRT